MRPDTPASVRGTERKEEIKGREKEGGGDSACGQCKEEFRGSFPTHQEKHMVHCVHARMRVCVCV